MAAATGARSSRESPSMSMLNVRLRRASPTTSRRRASPITVATTTTTTTMPVVPESSMTAPTPSADSGGKQPLRLTDDQLTAVLRAAEPLAIGDRGAFLQDVAAALQGQELGDGTVYRVTAQVQRRYYDPPNLSAPPRWGR
jgi:hypothetical protein